MFQLTSGADTYSFDIAGAVQLAGAAAGTWTTNNTNQIVVTLTAGGAPVVFTVDWLFNTNQLQIMLGGAVVFNFHLGTAVPQYSNLKDVLVAQPDSNAAFSFQLRGAWKFDTTNNLTITIGTQDSTLDGFLQDTTGMFSYHFFDLAGNENVLQFPGTWKQEVVNGKNVVTLHYDTEDGKGGDFLLPGDVNLDPSINEFVYSYNKAADTFSLQFVGTLHISSDFTITYALSTGSSTTFKMDAAFNKTDFNGNLDLELQSAAGQGMSITIGGNFTAVIGGGSLTVGFHFTQPASGNTQSFGFNGEFKSTDGKTDLSFDVESAGGTVSVSLAGQFSFGPVTGTARFLLTAANGQVTAIQGLFGIQF